MPKLKPKSKELTVAEIKKMTYKEIQKKKKSVDPEKFNTRVVEDRLAEEEAMEQIYAMILDDLWRKRYSNNGQTALRPSAGQEIKIKLSESKNTT